MRKNFAVEPRSGMNSVPLRNLHDSAVTRLAESAAEVGLRLKALLPAGPVPEAAAQRLAAWFAAGRAGEMAYLERQRPILADPRTWKPWARSLALFTAAYPRRELGFRGGGRVARYALGRDYHHVLGRRLQRLGRRLQDQKLVARFRAVTDAAPILEKEWALAGHAGFRGKNTLVLDQEVGPWLLLGELLMDTEWPTWLPDAPSASCGTCTRCLDACPTNAFPAPYLLDPRRCISYLTIEHRSSLPLELRRGVGDWVFGCDVCLEVCPFGTRAAEQAADWGELPALQTLSLEDLLRLSPADYRHWFRGSPIRRAGYGGLLRNACVALGNLGRGAPALAGALEHPLALVRGHAAWALGIQGEEVPLRRALSRESDPSVRGELEAALAAAGS